MPCAMQRLDGLPALWQQKLSNAAAQQKERIDNPSKSRHSDSKTQDGTHIPATASIKVLFEMHIAGVDRSFHRICCISGRQLASHIPISCQCPSHSDARAL